MSTLENIQSLGARVADEWPSANTEIFIFDSGAILLDVKYRNRLFVFSYAPNCWFGVDEIFDDTGFDMHFRFGSRDFSEARNELLCLLKNAQGE